MEPATWLIIGALIFGGYEHHRAGKYAEKIEVIEQDYAELYVTSQSNADAALESAVVAKQNGDIANGLSDDLNQCVEKLAEYQKFESDYAAVNEANAVAIEELEKRITESDLSKCSVPYWLVDTYTGEAAAGNSD